MLVDWAGVNRIDERSTPLGKWSVDIEGALGLVNSYLNYSVWLTTFYVLGVKLPYRYSSGE